MTNVVRAVLASLALASLPAAAPAAANGAGAPLLLQKPTVSRTHVAFSFAGDLWIVGREGGEARRLTNGVGRETEPFFCPDGSLLAFTGEYDGNVDVYVVEAGGGVPRRLTWHPAEDHAAGWTPDGQAVLFRSGRASFHYFDRLFTLPLSGGLPRELPLPRAVQGSFSPDGRSLAYVPINQWQPAWKRYRGGRRPRSGSPTSPTPPSCRAPGELDDSCPSWLGIASTSSPTATVPSPSMPTTRARGRSARS